MKRGTNLGQKRVLVSAKVTTAGCFCADEQCGECESVRVALGLVWFGFTFVCTFVWFGFGFGDAVGGFGSSWLLQRALSLT